jgi:polar amino acid transport system substrate-binding protein
MMRIVYGLLVSGWSLAMLAMAAGAAGAACEPDKVATKYPALAGKTIVVGQDGESPPFSFRNPTDFDTLIGLDADMARAVFACIGVPITFKVGAWSGLIPAAMAGQVDVMWDTLLYTPERAKRLDFVAYMRSATGAIVPKGNPKKIASLDDICGLQANANLGTIQEAMLREASKKCRAAGKQEVDIITSTDMPSGLRLLENGRTDVVVTNRFLADRRAAESKTIEVAFSVVTDALIAAATAKGNPDLVKAIADGLKDVRASGALTPIYERYKVDYDLTMEPEVLTR